ncbi:ABC transporter ATP-binding protein [Streptococcus massiliensis]|uniref:Nitrate/sulfonate/bicarbonate ABC transporter ATP-binding protein n=1 Tax=Streptococcus massiliensis TaxID=313439 RepID=A0A380KXG3_9STRE|nr:ABC transporter ATP-binding protein [Streptococcus massiliensis]SUN76335.1 nitrate/sulfonate/bicarbonate ABC transporter ATP-binding protein [Streptococcus massiliensis]
MTKIEIRNVNYAYDSEKILQDISLQVASGEIVSILGPSGVGKTTLFNLIAGILQPQAGSIILDDQENPKGRVSYMLQKDLLLEHKTVLGNVVLPLLIQKVPKKEAFERADEILSTFQLDGVRDKYPHELSGGMRQRVALLRTYLFGYKLFLLDEAFSALDELTKMELHRWYLDIHERLGLTTLIITHSIEEALTLSDRIYLLKNRPGQIVAELDLAWTDTEDKEIQKLAYKQEILRILGLE